MGNEVPTNLPLFEESEAVPTSLEGEDRRERMIRLAAALLQLGVSNTQVTKLLAFDLDLVERQLTWLPFRSARKRSSLIVSAIENDYEAPANWEADENE